MRLWGIYNEEEEVGKIVTVWGFRPGGRQEKPDNAESLRRIHRPFLLESQPFGYVPEGSPFVTSADSHLGKAVPLTRPFPIQN